MHRICLILVFSLLAGCADIAPPIAPLEPAYKVDGHNAAELSAEWWKWAMSTPPDTNPVRDTSGANCGVAQEGKVWFLAGGFGSSKIKRNCVVPAGKFVFFPVINMVYWPREENNGYTCDQAKKNASVYNDEAIELFVEVDGKAVNDVKKFRARTEKCFDVFERVPRTLQPPNAYPSASDGFWLLFAPLPKGKHTIKFGGRYNSDSSNYGRMVQDIEYEVSIE